MSEYQRLIAYLDGLPLVEDASQQSKVHALRTLRQSQRSLLECLSGGYSPLRFTSGTAACTSLPLATTCERGSMYGIEDIHALKCMLGIVK